ncbi:cytochrome P450 [Xylariaceae sp. FL0016]|nr:cytochrome P450 [Xylariaceae sp. FL0016]
MLLTLLPTSALAVVIWLALQRLTKRFTQRNLDMPYLSFSDGDNSAQRYAQQSVRLLKQGYEQYSKKGQPFSMFNHTDKSRPIAVLPTRYLVEVRGANATELSFSAFLNKQACDQLMPKFLPPSHEWTPQGPFMCLLPLASRLMARVLLGPELWDNDEWHAVMNAYFQAGFVSSAHVREHYHPWLRWASRYLNKEVKAIYAARRKGRDILKPVVDARLAETRNRSPEPKHGPRFGDGIGWLVDSYLADNKNVSTDLIMQDLAFLFAASVHSIALTALSILLDLVGHPESMAEIRDEISKVYAEHQGGTRQSLGALRVLDSFMKESQRFNNFQFNTMQRMALVDYTFKDGLRLPAGTSIVIPSRLLGRDPDLHADAAHFDAKRWQRMREQGDAAKFHFASLQDDMLPWGSGPHACPGRFLAQDIIKLIFIHLLTKYDMKYPEGVEGRPHDMPDNVNLNPNMMAQLLFKER